MASSQINKFATHKWNVFFSMYLGYTLAMLGRKSFSFSMPSITKELNLDKDDLGLIASSQNLAYTISKFAGGVMADAYSPRKLFCVGLFLSGIVIISFTAFEAVWIYAFLWFLCGFAQGPMWPACAKLLRKWFPASELGTWWSVLSSSMNLACSAGPMVATYIIVNHGWRTSFQIFGTLGIGVASLCLLTLVDSPEDVGLESLAEEDKDKDSKGRSRSRGRGTWKDLMVSPLMWVLCIAYCGNFVVRTALLDWTQLYLIEERGQDQYVGSAFVTSLELGGIVGSLLAGYAGDYVVAMTKREDTRGTPRMWVMIAFLLVNALSLHAIVFFITGNSSKFWINTIAFVTGFSTYGPVTLFGVMALESAPSHLAGTSHALVSLGANIGGIMAGLPFSFIAKHYDWTGAFIIMEILTFAVLTIMVLARNMEYKMIPTKKKLN